MILLFTVSILESVWTISLLAHWFFRAMVQMFNCEWNRGGCFWTKRSNNNRTSFYLFELLLGSIWFREHQLDKGCKTGILHFRYSKTKLVCNNEKGRIRMLKQKINIIAFIDSTYVRIKTKTETVSSLHQQVSVLVTIHHSILTRLKNCVTFSDLETENWSVCRSELDGEANWNFRLFLGFQHNFVEWISNNVTLYYF
jgi:hypothetical protein